MLEARDIALEALAVAKKNFGDENVARVDVKPMVDLDGDDAWRVLIVLQPDAVDKIGGDAVLDNLVQIHERLRKKGDERLPFVQFATEEELRELGDLKS